ncbi:hypothetical protein T492DRAFT_907090 [Pavlovales sp. CCMP2436]|nr:hypothetical protein T492DRAFT_907090 [Pavlovales sp. CCMP2436]
MSPLRRSGAAVAPSFAWDRVRSGGSSKENSTRLAYEASPVLFSPEAPGDWTNEREDCVAVANAVDERYAPPYGAGNLSDQHYEPGEYPAIGGSGALQQRRGRLVQHVAQVGGVSSSFAAGSVSRVGLLQPEVALAVAARERPI